MKNIISLLLLIIIAIGCSSDDNKNKNPNIPNYNFAVTLNLALPSYISITSPGNGLKYSADNAPELIVFNSGTGYVAFDAACPNEPAGSCASMKLKGADAICSCDKKEYSLFTGQSASGGYAMKQYRTDLSGNLLRIYN